MRSFTIKSIIKYGNSKSSHSGGRYLSETPVSAAKKAFTKTFSNNTKKNLKAKIVIQETTQNSLKKKYTYSIKRIYNPIEIKKNNEIITYKYQYKISSLK